MGERTVGDGVNERPDGRPPFDYAGRAYGRWRDAGGPVPLDPYQAAEWGFRAGWEAARSAWTESEACATCGHEHGPDYDGGWGCLYRYAPGEGPLATYDGDVLTLPDGTPIRDTACHCRDFWPAED